MDDWQDREQRREDWAAKEAAKMPGRLKELEAAVRVYDAWDGDMPEYSGGRQVIVCVGGEWVMDDTSGSKLRSMKGRFWMYLQLCPPPKESNDVFVLKAALQRVAEEKKVTLLELLSPPARS